MADHFGKLRLTGVDLFRGIGSFAVAVLHSGDTTNSLTIDVESSALRQFCGFVVPFFLVTSFYIAINRFSLTGKSYSIRTRLQRLLVPYAFWTMVYLLVRSLKFLLLHESDSFDKTSDITSVIFFGAASVSLYFIPLLFIGSLLLILAEYLIEKETPFYQILILFIASIIAYQELIDSNNYSRLGPNVAFQEIMALVSPNLNQPQLVRVLLVFMEWIMQCAPYVFAAMLLNSLLLRYKAVRTQRHLLWLSLLIFLSLSVAGQDILPQVLYAVLRATFLLLFSIQASSYLTASPLIQSLGVCSFGIYLMHYLVIQVLQVLLGKFRPELVTHVSIASQFLFASLSFGVSWLITDRLIRQKRLTKLMFGV